MKFGPLSKLRINLGRPLLRWIFGSASAAFLRRRLSRERLVPGLDPELALMLALDDRTQDTQLWRHSPAGARRKLAESIALVQGPVLKDDGVAVTPLLIPGPAGALPARIYAPTAPNKDKDPPGPLPG